MQYSADFVAIGMHRADVQRAELRLARQVLMERDSAGAPAPVEPAPRRLRGHGRAPRLALR
ncbi:MAG TPA: hypothetical protein VF000_09315 [Agromyces sp.]|jgi:hypothetical protein